MKYYFSLIMLLILTVSCSSESLSVREAKTLIENFSERYPIYESSKIDIGNQNYRVNKDKETIEALRKLEAEGFLVLSDVEQTKRWFSRDSLLSLHITLSPDAANYVVSQKKNTVEVKTFVFQLDREKDISLELQGNNRARVKATLIKKSTPFTSLGKDKNPNTAFIKKEFNLRYKKESGWYVLK